MIDNLFFETTNIRFAKAQGLIWVENGLSQLSIFEKKSGERLGELIKFCDKQKTILIDFKNIVRLDDHSLDDVYDSLKGNTKQMIVLNGNGLFDDFTKLKKEENIDIRIDTNNEIIILGNQKEVDIKAFLEEVKQYKETHINSILKATFSKFDRYKRLSSTPFLANGEFDSKRIIECPKDFMWISFYLSDKLEKIINSKKLDNIVLVSASLRGATFASILGILNDLDYINIDHIGPIHKVYDFNSLNFNHRNQNYFYIGDFVFGGTEIKLTKVYASFIGAELNHALVLGSLFKAEVFNDFELYELNTLNKISKEANFKLFE